MQRSTCTLTRECGGVRPLSRRARGDSVMIMLIVLFVVALLDIIALLLTVFVIIFMIVMLMFAVVVFVADFGASDLAFPVL